ncbi:MAG TPA: surface-adhesin E family protein [Phenylobacterium sp.]|nr:surface-adhesin E family protein [Phenylobacterium sp.]
MRHMLIGLSAMVVGLAGSAACAAAPFAPASFHKGRSVLVYDTSTVDREGPYTRAWVYLIVRYPMDGATMVAYRREFACRVGQSRDLARRFVDPAGRTVRAVENPTEWQSPEPGSDDHELMERVCGRKPAGPAMGKGMTVFDYHDAVQAALGAGTTQTASR